MSVKAYTIISEDFNPYKNLALEEYLLYNLQDDEIIMYLWQNKQTVVIGKNQNCRAECKLDSLRDDGGYLARRPSGGGAVYHDLGNLNFTFLAKKDIYDVQKQLDVIINAVKILGLSAQKSGRNDIAIDERKFSGNAFYSAGDNKFHHGTILINADMTKLSNYLTVSTAKLKSKGVKSVKSRVVNLCDLNPDITVESVKKALVTAFEGLYRTKSETLPKERIDENNLAKRFAKFSSSDWLYGTQREYNYTVQDRFSWGGIELSFCVSGQVITQCDFFTDALDDTLSQKIVDSFVGINFDKNTLNLKLDKLSEENPHLKEIISDIKSTLTEV